MSFASPFPEVDIPSTSVYDYLFGGIDDADLDRVALVDAKTGTETTYREMVGRIDAFAGALAGRGIGVGDDGGAAVAQQLGDSRSPFTASCGPARRPPPSTRCSPPRTSPSS